jgi:hypothetical protein
VPKEVKSVEGIRAAHFASLRALVEQIRGR